MPSSLRLGVLYRCPNASGNHENRLFTARFRCVTRKTSQPENLAREMHISGPSGETPQDELPDRPPVGCRSGLLVPDRSVALVGVLES
ncbi:MAG: hypothetical protein ACKOCW_03835, partial [Planctomycetaceae bacterium]